MPRLKLVSSPLEKADGFQLTAGNLSESSTRELKLQQTENSYRSYNSQDSNGDAVPQFVKHAESTNIELFYDLFFVANLTSFSNVHEVNSRKSLTSYIGFFCVLWFTWCQTSLFDIRFVADSWLERAAKAVHLGVMVGLAIVGPSYDTEGENSKPGKDSTNSLRTMAFILCVSRFVLGLQYLLIGWHVRNYRKTKLPLGLLSGTMMLAALIYLIVSFIFLQHEHAYRAFYVVAGFEMLFNIAISSKWKVVSFKKTHLIERMSLLTLYILGEGVIDVLKSLTKMVQIQADTWTSADIGSVVAAITAIYFLYMLYFDCLNHRHFGSIRQQFWAFAHFPFHVALVLSLTGLAQFAKWYKVVQVFAEFLNLQDEAFFSVLISNNGTYDTPSGFDYSSFADTVNETITEFFDKYTPVYATTFDNFGMAVQEIRGGVEALNGSVYPVLLGLQNTVIHSIYTTYGFEAEEAQSNSNDSTNATALAAQELKETGDNVLSDLNAISIVFTYFLISAGMTLVIMGIMSLIMDTHKRRWSLGTVIRFVSHIVIGLTVSLLALMGPHDSGQNLMFSAGMLPIYTVAIAIVLLVHHIKWGKSDTDVDEIDYTREATE